MKQQDDRARRGRFLVLAALASTLLASCSTASDSGSPFSFNLASIVPTSATENLAGDAIDTPSAQEEMATAPDMSDAEATEEVMAEAADEPAVELASGEEPVAPIVTSAVEPQAQIQERIEAAHADATDAEPAEEIADASQPVEDTQVAAAEPEKRGFLASFFSRDPAPAAVAARAAIAPTAAPLISQERAQAAAPAPEPAREEPRPLVQMASTGPIVNTTPLASYSGEALPGVRGSLFEITRRSSLDEDDGDLDLYESEGSYQVASAAGLARLAPNGLLRQREDVDVACLRPSLVRILQTVERHFGQRVMVTSGYRSAQHNRRVRGARNSFHMQCAAADIQVAGVSNQQLAQFVRALPGRGGVGTYCHTQSVHVDVGPERDWNWRCRRR